MTSGFGIPATSDRDRASEVARRVEILGFASIWTNDVPRADGIRTAAFLASATEHLRLGVGVVACDRRPAREIAGSVSDSGLPFDRFVLGVGAGSAQLPLSLVRESVRQLRELLGPEVKIGVGAMGSRMCSLAGQVADLVLLNWMVPARIRWARDRIASGASRAGRPVPEIASYVRVALDPEGRQRIRAEAEKYYAMPAYRRHFEAMGEDLSSVGVSGSPDEVVSVLPAYTEVLDEVIVRALPGSDSVESTLAVAEATAPARWL